MRKRLEQFKIRRSFHDCFDKLVKTKIFVSCDAFLTYLAQTHSEPQMITVVLFLTNSMKETSFLKKLSFNQV